MATTVFTKNQLQSLMGGLAKNQVKPAQQNQTSKKKKSRTSYPPLDSITQPSLKTSAAAFYLNREDQTLREWACKGSGPIKPIRIQGRLAWPVNELRKLLGAEK